MRTSQDLHVDAATKAQQQTGTSNAAVVTPGIQRDHHGTVKAWVSWTAATSTTQYSYNVSGVSRSAAGTYTVTFTTAFANALYVCSFTTEATSTLGIIGNTTSRSTNAVAVQVLNSGFIGADPQSVMLACYGRS